MLAGRHTVQRAVAVNLLAGVLTIVAACSPAQPGSAPPGSSVAERAPARPNVLRIAANGDVSVFHDRLKPVSDLLNALAVAGKSALGFQAIFFSLLAIGLNLSLIHI